MGEEYENFDIQVIATGVAGKYKLLIKYPNCQPASGKWVDCELPPGYADLRSPPTPQRSRRWRRDMSALEQADDLIPFADLENVKELGRRLFATLLPGELAGRFGMLAESGRTRLRINLTEAPALSVEPWEALYRPETETLLAIDTGTMIVRQLDSSSPADRRPVVPPVRLLVFSAVPGDDLDVAQEVANIGRRLQGAVHGRLAVPFEVQLLEKATRSGLRERLRDFEPHLLHYIGHGSFGPDRGWIHLHSGMDEAAVDRIDSETLRNMLAVDPPKLVVLNTCQGATAAKSDSFAGTAQALAQRGIPYVVAMQYAVSDRAAIAFSDSLYANLARGDAVDVAVTKARNSIGTDEDRETQPELITPVLYVSGAAQALIAAAEGVPPPPKNPEGPVTSPAVESPGPPSRLKALLLGGTALIGVIGLLFAYGSNLSSGDDSLGDNVASNLAVDLNSTDSSPDGLDSIEEPSAKAPPGRPSTDPSAQAGEDDRIAVRLDRGSPGAGPGPGRGPASLDPPEPPPEPSVVPSPPDPVPPPSPPPPTAFDMGFQPGSAALSAAAAAQLDNVAEGYRREPFLNIALSGRIGRATAANVALAQRRTDAVREYLIARGVPADAIAVQAVGESGPPPDPAGGIAEPDSGVEVIVFPGGPDPGTGPAPPAPAVRLLGAGLGPAEAIARSAAFSNGAPELILRIVARGGAEESAREGLAGFAASALVAAGVPEERISARFVAGGEADPAPVEAELAFMVPEAEEARFGHGQARPGAGEAERIARFADWALRRPEVGILLRGHADSSGRADFNSVLSLERAERVAAALAARGVAPERIRIEAAGESLPSAGPAPDPGRDRRVEMIVVPPGAEP